MRRESIRVVGLLNHSRKWLDGSPAWRPCCLRTPRYGFTAVGALLSRVNVIPLTMPVTSPMSTTDEWIVVLENETLDVRYLPSATSCGGLGEDTTISG